MIYHCESSDEFQSPSCGAVFGTGHLALLTLGHFVVSVAFMRRGVRDAVTPSATATYDLTFQSPSCGAVFGTNSVLSTRC